MINAKKLAHVIAMMLRTSKCIGVGYLYFVKFKNVNSFIKILSITVIDELLETWARNQQ